MFIYPRLSPEAASRQFEELTKQYEADGTIRYRGEFWPPNVTLPNISGVPVPTYRLKWIHSELIEKLPPRTVLTKEDNRKFDIEIGKLFLKVFEEDGRVQAADSGVWAYLSLVAFPDVAFARFRPAKGQPLTKERFISSRRNAFYAPYLRALIFGDRLGDPDAVLYEDELVGLVDRELSTDHRLVHAIADVITTYEGGNRREMVRDGLKNVLFRQRITEFSTFTDAELRAEIEEIMLPPEQRRKPVAEVATESIGKKVFRNFRLRR